MNCFPSSSNTATTGSCIVVGGGMSGVMVANYLQKSGCQVTIVDRQNYLDWSPASARSLVSPDDIEKKDFTMPLGKIAEHLAAEFVHSAVSQVGEKSVTLENGKVLEADCVVVSIGGQYASGALWKATPELTTKEKRIEAFRAEKKHLESAHSVVIAGAGLAGVEVAGEIKSAFSAKTVVLVGTLLASSTDVGREKVKKALLGLGVILKDGRVEGEPVNGKVTTTKGETIDADIVYNAAGFVFAGSKLLNQSLQANVTERGQLLCRPTLQLNGCDTVFATGDIVKVPEGKFADTKGLMHGDETAKVVAKNVLNFLSGDNLDEFKWSDKPLNSPSFTALGPGLAVGDMGMPKFLSGFEDWMCLKLKADDFFTSMKAKGFGKGKSW
mmetsp:Transcript_21251/g.31463  ORF Transcript_21251/g.31463 Transcript_21251/m.31463 type:complete len:384 (+) Transcript_21251:24-1175(+)